MIRKEAAFPDGICCPAKPFSRPKGQKRERWISSKSLIGKPDSGERMGNYEVEGLKDRAYIKMRDPRGHRTGPRLPSV